MRRSDWRSRADDPKGLFGWWWRSMLERSFLPLVPLGAAALAFGTYPWSAFVFLCAGLPLTILARTSIASESSRLSALLAEPGPEGRFRAIVEYRRNRVTLGQDPMALTAVDGWLIGEGVRSGFALRSEDVALLRYRRRFGHSLLTLTDGTRIRVTGRGPETHQALVDWRIGNDRPDGEAVFPPSGAHPQEIARWGARAVAGTVLISAPNLVASALHLGSRGAEYRIALALVGFGLGSWAWFRLGRLAEGARVGGRREPLPEQTQVSALPPDSLGEAKVRG